jgi:predicted ferric reductase
VLGITHILENQQPIKESASTVSNDLADAFARRIMTRTREKRNNRRLKVIICSAARQIARRLISFSCSNVGSIEAIQHLPTALHQRMNILARSSTVAFFSWILFYFFNPKWFKEFAGQLLKDAKGGTPLVAFGIPILLAGAVCFLMSVRMPDAVGRRYISSAFAFPHQLPPRIQLVMHSLRCCCSRAVACGDIDFDTVSFLFIFLPSLYFVVSVIRTKLEELKEKPEDISKKIMDVSNVFGYIAITVMSVFLLLPVARHSALTAGAFGWSHAGTIRLHVWSGRIVLVAVLIHGGMYFYRWKVVQQEGILSLLIPPAGCWTLQDTDYTPTCQNIECTCYHHFRNLTGFGACVVLLVIGGTTMNSVRRKSYSLFYKVHVISGPLAFILVILHWKRSIVYLAGGLLFYIASSCPVWVENWLSIRRDGGVKILSVDRLSAGETRPCTSITFEASDTAMSRYRAGHYVRLYCPELSGVAHPFSINAVPGQANQLRILFRSTGPFTTRLAHALSSNTTFRMPIGLDGFHGSPSRTRQVLQHDTVVLVAGGIGITPYLTLLHRVHAALCIAQGTSTTKTVILHWICRDASLIQYVKHAYFDTLLGASDATGFSMKIVIHRTGRAGRALQTTQELQSIASTDFEQHATLQGSLEPVDGDGIEDSIVPGAGASIGQPFSPSKFSPGSKNSYPANVPPFLSFCTTACIGLVIVWYCYSSLQDDHEVLTRIWSPLLLVGLGLGVALVTNVLYRLSLLHDEDEVLEAGWTTVGEQNEHDPLSSLELTVKSADSVPTLQQQEEVAEHCPVHVEERQGRPDMIHLVRCLDQGKHPAVFVCGPDALTDHLREAIGHGQIWDPRRYLPQRGRVSLYQESFYM